MIANLNAINNLASTARTRVHVPVTSHDGLRVGPPQSIRLGPVAKVDRVAMATEYLGFWPVIESRSIQSPITLSAAHTILVVGPRLGHYPLNLEHLPLHNRLNG